MRVLADIPIRAKLGLVILIVSVLALGLSTLLAAVGEARDYRDAATRELATLATLLGNRSTAALAFDDEETAAENLRALASLPNIRRACLFDADGALFAGWSAGQGLDCAARSTVAAGVEPASDGFSVQVPVELDGEQLGTLSIYGTLDPLRERLRTLLSTRLAITLLAAVLAGLLAWWVASRITVPLMRVRDAAAAVGAGADTGLRAPVEGGDEVGQLAGAFNRMLDTLDAQRRLLEDSANYTRVLFNDSRIALVVMEPEHGIITDCNRAAVAIAGFESREALLGLRPGDFAAPVQPDGTDSAAAVRERLDAARAGQAQVFEWRHRRPDGTVWDAEVHVMPFRIGDRTLLQSSLTDITDRKAAEAALRASEERLRNIAGNVPGAILREVGAVGEAPEIEYISAGCRLLWEIDPADAIHAPQRLAAMVHPEDREALDASRRASAQRMERWACQWRIVPPSGTQRWLEGTGQPMRRADGRVAWDSVVFDVTERVRAADALARLNADLEQRNLELQRFVTVASHDLQEPLRKVEIFVDRLQSDLAGGVDPAALDRMQRLRRAASRMRDLVDALLGYSALARTAVAAVPVELADAVGEALEDLEVAIEGSGAVVEVGPLPVVSGCPRELRQLFLNLVGNAVKYRAAGRPPRISITAECASGRARVVVRDNGVGFDNAHAERIFAPFQRLHAASEFGGTGIGLSIVRKIAERHGGTVRASGEAGVGAEFVVELPLVEAGSGD